MDLSKFTKCENLTFDTACTDCPKYIPLYCIHLLIIVCPKYTLNIYMHIVQTRFCHVYCIHPLITDLSLNFNLRYAIRRRPTTRVLLVLAHPFTFLTLPCPCLTPLNLLYHFHHTYALSSHSNPFTLLVAQPYSTYAYPVYV